MVICCDKPTLGHGLEQRGEGVGEPGGRNVFIQGRLAVCSNLTRRAPHHRGFTLAEIMLALALSAFLIFEGLLHLQHSKTVASTRGMAEMIAEQLRLARLHAIAEQRPVGIVFPSSSGSVPHGQSLYFLEGETLPQITRTLNFAGDFPTACCFVGIWPIDNGALKDPTATTSISQPRTGTAADTFKVSDWASPLKQDYYFVFTPAGTLKTNDLPSYDHEFHILVSAGIQFSGGSLTGTATVTPAPAYFNADLVAQPYTITISPLGAVAVSPGIPAGQANQSEGPLGLGSPAPATEMVTSPNHYPVITAVSLLPTPAGGGSPLVQAGGHTSLEIRATDPDGDRLYCKWSAKDPAGVEVGGFSSPDEDRLEWQAAGYWKSTWQWRPPAGATTGTIYSLVGTISDHRGGVVTTTSAGFPVDVGLSDSGHIPVTSGGFIGAYINIISSDGSSRGDSLTPITTPVSQDLQPVLSSDGQRVVFISQKSGSFPQEVWIMNADGTDRQQLTNLGNICRYPRFSNDGSKIVYSEWLFTGSTLAFEIVTMNADGSGRTRLTDQITYPFGDHKSPSFSPDGSKIAYVSGTTQLNVMNADGSASTPVVTTPSGALDSPTWHPVPANPQILFTYLQASASSYELYTVKPDGTGLAMIPAGPAIFKLSPCFSPKGLKIAFDSGSFPSQVMTMNADGSSLTPLTSLGDGIAQAGSWSW